MQWIFPHGNYLRPTPFCSWDWNTRIYSDSSWLTRSWDCSNSGTNLSRSCPSAARCPSFMLNSYLVRQWLKSMISKFFSSKMFIRFSFFRGIRSRRKELCYSVYSLLIFQHESRCSVPVKDSDPPGSGRNCCDSRLRTRVQGLNPSQTVAPSTSQHECCPRDKGHSYDHRIIVSTGYTVVVFGQKRARSSRL